MITFIDGIIDLIFKIKRGDTNVVKLKKEFSEHMETSRQENLEKVKLILPNKSTEDVKK